MFMLRKLFIFVIGLGLYGENVMSSPLFESCETLENKKIRILQELQKRLKGNINSLKDFEEILEINKNFYKVPEHIISI